MIEEIVFEGNEEFKGYYVEDSNQSIKKLSRVNVFIGANNSGKSRFLRALFKEGNVGFNLNGFPLDQLRIDLKKFQESLELIFNSYQESKGNIPKDLTELAIEPVIQKEKSKPINDLLQTVRKYKNNNLVSEGKIGSNIRRSILPSFHQAVEGFEFEIMAGFENPPYFEGTRTYIPMLRGLRPMVGDKGSNDFYKARTVKDYFEKKEMSGCEIYTGLSLYNDLWQFKGGLFEQRQKVVLFEKFLSEAFFSNQAVTITPIVSDDVVHITIGNEERPIHMLGDGIQALIVLLYPLFFNAGKQMLVFIEEPEHSLHPGLQRVFIETLHRPEFAKFQYFITTHSNHFLDLTEEEDMKVSVYTFEKRESGGESAKYWIRNVSNNDQRSLELLGVRSSSVFLSNCTIWVEGVTDRLYLRRYLEVYQEHLKSANKNQALYREDLHFSFVEYSGSNLTHWSFEEEAEIDKIKALKISSRIFVIADSDDTEEKPDSAKAQRLAKLKNVLSDKCYVHPSREMENTLHENVLLNTVVVMEGKSPAIVGPKKSFTQADYSKLKIGGFIEDKFQNLDKKYKGEGGTIYNKKGFCEVAVTQINGFDDLSQEAQELVKKLHTFIASSNPK